MATALGTKKIENLKPEAKDYELSDGSNGLRLRVTPAGRKVWRWHYRPASGAPQKVLTLGYFTREGEGSHMSLTAARKKLEDLKNAQAEHRLGEALGDAPDTPRTVKDLAEEFYRVRILPHRRRPETVRDVLDRDVLPAIGGRSLAGFNTAACRTVVKAVVERGATTYAGAVLGVLKQMGRFGQGNNYLQGNPAAPLEAQALGVVANQDNRWLTSEEIILWWKALDGAEMTPTVRLGLRLLLFTGLRTGELLKARWSDVDLKAATLTVPVENQKLKKKELKKARPFVVPLAPEAVEILKELKRLAGKSPWVMYSPRTTKEGKKEEERITDKTLARANRRLWEESRTRGNRREKGRLLPPLLTISQASPHDLRRTMRSHLGKLRVPLHIAERCLNHSLGRIVETYDQGDYIEERREAMEKWGDFIGRLVRGETAEVVDIREVT